MQPATPLNSSFGNRFNSAKNWVKANPGKMIGGTAVGTVGVAGIASRNPGFTRPAPMAQGAMQQPQAQMYFGQSQQKVSNFNPVASQLLSKFGYDLEYAEELEGLDGKGPNEKYLSAMKTNWMKERKKAGKSTSIPNSVNTVDKFLDFITKTSSQRLRTTVFALDDDNNLLHGFSDDGFYKFPGGGVDPGEDILEAAKRELLEEAGYQVKSISELPGIESVTGVGKSSAKASMGNTSSLTKYLIAKLGDKDTSVFGSEGDAIANLRLAPVDQVMRGLEGDTLFGSSIAQSNLDALKQIIMQKQAEDHVEMRMRERAKFMKLDELNSLKNRVSSSKDLPEGAHYITLPHGRKAVVETKNGKSYIATILSQTMRPPGRDVTNKLSKAAGFIR